MKAVLLSEPWKIQCTDIEQRPLKAGEALLKIKSAGICGSDIGAFRGANGLVSYPRIIGHELAGEILKVPADNPKGFQVGDRVLVDPYLFCDHCYPCSLGRTNCCEALNVLGVHIDGGFAETFAHPAALLVKLPTSIPWDIAPLVEPLVISIHGLHRLQVKAGEHVAIFGAGPIGLLAAMAAITYGAHPIMIDVVDARLDFAKELGVQYVINPVKENTTQRISEITNGRMAECVMEASGSKVAIVSTLDVVSYAGRIAFTGWPKSETPLNTTMITKKEVDIRGSRTSAGEFEEAISLVAEGKVDVRKILTKTISLEEVPATVIDIEKNPQNYLKVNAIF